jgi:hypothetical protein
LVVARLRNDGIIHSMSSRDTLETDTRVVDAPDAPREIPETENATESPRGEVLDDPEKRREESAELRQRVEGDWTSRPFKVDREELGRFDLKRAGLPDMGSRSPGLKTSNGMGLRRCLSSPPSRQRQTATPPLTKRSSVMASFYWERDPNGPFATLIRVAATYLHPENYDLDSLKRLAKRENDHEMRVFKSELREALSHPSRYQGTSCRGRSSTTKAATRRSYIACGTTSTATRLREPGCCLVPAGLTLAKPRTSGTAPGRPASGPPGRC